jgi:hypothetical protein
MKLRDIGEAILNVDLLVFEPWLFYELFVASYPIPVSGNW